MPVRDAVPSDLPEILAMVRELAEYEREPDSVVFDAEEFASNVFGENAVARVLIAHTDEGATAGFALWFRTFSTWLGRSGIWLEDLFVRPEHRRLGLGRALLDELRARTQGRVEWAVLDWNTPAHEFYRRVGAVPLDGWTTWRWTTDTR
ncbi:MAG: N-acetyltransferase [Acidimicrobiia bacterium]|nr:MAG: N-acetyltransferase [Acidimicrobiia bacterium]